MPLLGNFKTAAHLRDVTLQISTYRQLHKFIVAKHTAHKSFSNCALCFTTYNIVYTPCYSWQEGGSWNFQIFCSGGRSKFLISGVGCPMWGKLYYLGESQFILSPFSRFEMQDFKNSKMFACDALIFNIHIFRFKMNAGLEVDIDLKH